jgi:hypothetical protein
MSSTPARLTHKTRNTKGRKKERKERKQNEEEEDEEDDTLHVGPPAVAAPLAQNYLAHQTHSLAKQKTQEEERKKEKKESRTKKKKQKADEEDDTLHVGPPAVAVPLAQNCLAHQRRSMRMRMRGEGWGSLRCGRPRQRTILPGFSR